MDAKKFLLLCLFVSGIRLGPAFALGQAPGSPLPAFEVVTIRPVDPNGGGIVGFLSRPGGRVQLGSAPVRMLLNYAFDIQDFQIAGGPAWIGSQKYNITALPPDSSPSRSADQPSFAATPSREQREMLQSLLADRFALRYHRETHDGPVFLLARGKKPLQLQSPKDPHADPRGAVVMKGDRIDGEAFGTNLSMAFLARQLSSSLHIPVLDKTGLSGTYDFHLTPDDPTNQDLTSAVFDAMDRLGLKLTRSRGPVETLVIDHIEQPTPN